MNALEIIGFTKSYGDVKAVDNVSLTIKEGEFFGFLGPNGAGKTTMIHSIVGINRFEEGTISVFDTDVQREYKKARTFVGHSPQEFNIDIFLPVTKILWYVGGFFGMTRKERTDRIEELLRIFELDKHKHKQFRQLSGGMKRRVMLARALMHDPALLILDEPTAGVDVELRNELYVYLKRINEEGKTILLTSHYLEEVEKLCERLAVIVDGRLVAQGTKKEIVADYKTLEEAYLAITANKTRTV